MAGWRPFLFFQVAQASKSKISPAVLLDLKHEIICGEVSVLSRRDLVIPFTFGLTATILILCTGVAWNIVKPETQERMCLCSDRSVKTARKISSPFQGFSGGRFDPLPLVRTYVRKSLLNGRLTLPCADHLRWN